MFPAKFARLFLILRVGIKAARNVLQVEKKVNFEPWIKFTNDIIAVSLHAKYFSQIALRANKMEFLIARRHVQ